MPLMERGKPVFSELLWILSGRLDEDRHEKILPDYCYNIFEAIRKTLFRNVPSVADIIYVKDRAALPAAKSIEAAKEAIRMDWRKLGKIVGIGLRCLRFAELEAENSVDGGSFDDLPNEKIKELFEVIFGKHWVDENISRITSEKPNAILADVLNQFIAPWMLELRSNELVLNSFAFQWSPAATAEFHAGIAEGLEEFIDENSQLVGETNRTGVYAFLALAWPEIKAMLESDPRKTLTDLHAWMLPFMRMGVATFLDIDKFRDLCAPPAQYGIGLSLRPLESSI